jgi:hypothetical protein
MPALSTRRSFLSSATVTASIMEAAMPKDYTLTPSELPAVRTLLAWQGTVEMGFDAPTLENVERLMDSIAGLSTAYPGFAEARFKDWVDQLFNAFVATPTSYTGHSFPVLYIAYHYLQWARGFQPIYVHAPEGGALQISALLFGWTVKPRQSGPDPDSDVWCPDHWPSRPYPQTWHDAIDVLKDGLGGYDYYVEESSAKVFHLKNDMYVDNDDAPMRLHPPADVFLEGEDAQAVVAFQTQVLSNWSNCGLVFANIAPVWKAQQDTVTAMLAPETLDGSQYFYLLHLLIAVASGTAAMREFAKSIVDYKTDKDAPEYPNDTFINQLIYAVLMELADPNGDDALTNQQLQALMTDLAGCITGPDDCSQAIKTSLQRHGRVLSTDSSYPMQDPEYPAVGFGTRKADALNVLDKARAALKAGAHAAPAVRMAS